ncbi:MAG: thiolase family protein [Deltaproteobacteria bacterium]|nr:thiolase family protein [Deltaproteobacteria bacterium]
MSFTKAFIPYKAYWSTPFCRWQGSFADLHAVEFAGETAQKVLKERNIPAEIIDSVDFGISIPQPSVFYGGPWVAALLGAQQAPGPMLGQACITGIRVINQASLELEAGQSNVSLALTADRCSNGPHLVYPGPSKPGGTPVSEDWVWDNFGNDPWAGNAMLQTAENVAKEVGITKEEQDEVAFLRYQQYQDAVADDKAFQRRYMVMPVEIKNKKGKVVKSVDGDEGIFPSTREGLASLKAVIPGGTVSYGSQTHPADANCGTIVCTREKARELSKDPAIEIQVISFAQARTKKGYMAMAVVPAARLALGRADLDIKDIAAIKTHNPFAVNDVYFCREFGVKQEDMNHYGSSMIYGHPQAPTAQRAVIELIEELVIRGGGYGLFAGCAAGDSGGSMVIKVDTGKA